jgi:hypothetical protein
MTVGGRCLLHCLKSKEKRKREWRGSVQGTPLPVIIIPEPGAGVMKDLQTIYEWFVKEHGVGETAKKLAAASFFCLLNTVRLSFE